ncbi:hypothetical protein Cfor_03856 [Coptotermes formosanus]|uniref:Peptidoglycan-recognition protein n=1 Tax=Coptotermes formosanus TaxID=36987 RepID=A0A6L2PZB2_COPFO|nr:hypothetical protein Cfor_03856 [Coptotermes formosanus]
MGSPDQCPSIISRSQWQARPPVSTPETLSVPVNYTVIHHGGSNSYCTTQTACAAIVRAYQNYHIDSNGWNDIGYNFVVGEDGNVYEGRGWNAVGAHAPTYNTKSIGICIIGDFTSLLETAVSSGSVPSLRVIIVHTHFLADRLPNQAALNAVKQLIQCGVDSNKIRSTYQLIGHRQNTASSTDCPGNALYNEIKSWSHWTANPKSVNGIQIAGEKEDPINDAA